MVTGRNGGHRFDCSVKVQMQIERDNVHQRLLSLSSWLVVRSQRNVLFKPRFLHHFWAWPPMRLTIHCRSLVLNKFVKKTSSSLAHSKDNFRTKEKAKKKFYISVSKKLLKPPSLLIEKSFSKIEWAWVRIPTVQKLILKKTIYKMTYIM